MANPGKNEPWDLEEIRRLRPSGPRRIRKRLEKADFRERLEGAILGRMAGCTLGAPVELWPVERMRAWARRTGDAFPPVRYWSAVPEPEALRYGTSPCSTYTREGMRGVPVDDDIAYTLLGLLIAEAYGPDFTTEEAGKAWVAYLPHACTAEKVALENLRAGVPAAEAGARNNPYAEWIGAAIRADPWGYMAPGWPEQAASMAYRDALLSHRGEGIHGAMYFAAVVAAAFAVSDPVEALRIGLTEIPESCLVAESVRWALEAAPGIGDHGDARAAVDERFPDLNPVHAVNNACLTVLGLCLGGTDFTRVISETVAMGLDNDCTAATAGSIAGAVVGKSGIPGHWHEKFEDCVHTYLIGAERFRIGELVDRFTAQARRLSGR